MAKPKDPSLIPPGRYCYRWVDVAPSEVVPEAGPEFGRLQRECTGFNPSVKQVLCPYHERSGYGTARCLFLGKEVAFEFFRDSIAPKVAARFGAQDAVDWFEEDWELWDMFKVCGVGHVPDPFEDEAEDESPVVNEVDLSGNTAYHHLNQLMSGEWVEHPEFGAGVAAEVVREHWGLRARVDFGLHGLIDLALNVARLRRVAALSAADEAAWRRPEAAPWAGLSLTEARRWVIGLPEGRRVRRVQASQPPFKALRGLMADVLASKTWRDVLFYESVWRVADPVWPLDEQGEEACGGWPGEDGAEGRALDMLNLPGALQRPETRVFLRKVMDRWFRRLEALQRKAVANGRWWPGPAFLFALLSSDGLLGMRLVFPAVFDREGELWFEYWHPRARTVRRPPTPAIERFKTLEDVGLKVVTVVQQYPELVRPVPSEDLPALSGCVWLLQTHVAGMAYHQAEQAMDSLQAGCVLQLRREPDNPHDTLAIEVLTASGVKLGYVPQNRNPVLARLMDAGQVLEARVVSLGTFPRDPQPWQTAAPEVRLRIDWRTPSVTV